MTSARASTDPVVVRELGTIDYLDAWDLQRSIAEQRAVGAGSDTLLLLEHPSVFTAGRRTADTDRPTDGTPVIDVDRGGKITWHGPGQLVGYPIVALASPIDVVRYVRRLEQALITVCTDLGLRCGRVEGRSGVWFSSGVVGGVWQPERKVAAIGVRVQKGVALHGFSLNCNPSLESFGTIVPCGIPDAGVTTLSNELGRDVDVAEMIPPVTAAITAALDGEIEVVEHNIERVEISTSGRQPEFTTMRFGA
ncbi:octanoyltransferase [Rhodococcoides trifolii]|uniref:Octanoyltransferase n=1 Tax=Rhodococcoides trifolii TaxID=908250 RepID=A0A917FSR1_9NOCA|nr:lipoyl(octanoyl) transferase LipB [Rhodococcus trifolii]GGG05022.1 octanoyltransferase [Rhodococcus trifolii]